MIASIPLLLLAASSLGPQALAFAPTRPLTSVAPTHHIIGSDPLGDCNKSIQRIKCGDPSIQQTSHLSTLFSTTNPDSEDEGDGSDAKKKSVRDEIFWAKQRALAAEMSAKTDAGLKQEQREKFAERRLALVSDTVYFSILIGSLLWLASPNPFVTISYLFGALSGTAYSYGLGKYVETIGGSIDDTEAEGAGLGQARFAFLILLFVVVGKFRSQGLLEIPSIMGFFTYQLASLGQGLREIDD